MNIQIRKVLGIALVLLLITTSAHADLAGWSYKRLITIDSAGAKVGATLTDAVVLVKLTDSSGIGDTDLTSVFDNCKADGSDIRFTQSDGSTLLSYEREKHPVAVDLTADLLVHFKLNDDLDTSNVIDTQGNANGTVVNDQNNWTSDQSIAGKVPVSDPKALDFDGTNDYIQMNDFVTAAASDTTGTIAFWIYFDTDTNDSYVSLFAASRNADATLTRIDVFVDFLGATNRIEARVYEDGAVQWHFYTPDGTALIGQWLYVEITQDGTEPRCFINGVDQTYIFETDTDKTKWMKAIFTDATNKADVCSIAATRNNGATNIDFDGKMDEWRYYQSAKGSGTRSALFNANNGTESESTSFNPPAYYWVEVNSIDSGTDTEIYLFYGNAGAADASSGTDTWSNNYLGVWHLADSAASTTVIESLGTHDGTFTSNTNTCDGTGKSTLGLGFKEAKLVTIANHADFSFVDGGGNDEPFTIVAYIDQLVGTGDYQQITGKWQTSGGNAREYWFRIDSGERIDFNLLDESSDTTARVVDQNAITVGSSYHLAGTYNGAGGALADEGLEIYASGSVRTPNRSNNGYTDMEALAGDLTIGASVQADPEYFVSGISMIRIISGEWSASQVGTDYYSMVDDLLTYGAEQPVTTGNFIFGGVLAEGIQTY